jgi:hypothetical protein
MGQRGADPVEAWPALARIPGPIDEEGPTPDRLANPQSRLSLESSSERSREQSPGPSEGGERTPLEAIQLLARRSVRLMCQLVPDGVR